jgi:hypothetical protein
MILFPKLSDGTKEGVLLKSENPMPVLHGNPVFMITSLGMPILLKTFKIIYVTIPKNGKRINFSSKFLLWIIKNGV